jgi:hypothetical protein
MGLSLLSCGFNGCYVMRKLQVGSAWASCCTKQQGLAASVAASNAELSRLCADLAGTAASMQQQQPAELSQVGLGGILCVVILLYSRLCADLAGSNSSTAAQQQQQQQPLSCHVRSYGMHVVIMLLHNSLCAGLTGTAALQQQPAQLSQVRPDCADCADLF